MSFKEVGGPVIYAKVSHILPPFFEGIYLGTYEGKYGPQHKFKSLSGRRQVWEGKGKNKTHTRDEDISEGIDVVFSSAGALDRKLEEVSVGTVCRIEYLGVKVLKTGDYAGAEFHDIRLLVSDEEPKLDNMQHGLTQVVDENTSLTKLAEEANKEEQMDSQVTANIDPAPSKPQFNEVDETPIHTDQEIADMMAALKG